jgi:DNA-directed RNA polymerase specialized sigma24 family protein
MTRVLAALAQQAVLELASGQAWPGPAIAVHLDWSVSTVKTRLRQARRQATQLARAERAPARAV